MKIVITMLVVGFACLPLSAQKVIEKNIAYSNQVIDVDVKFASEIEVKTWDKSTVYFKATLRTKDGKYLELYQLNVDEGNGYIGITSVPEPVFKAFHEEWEKNRPEGSHSYYHTHDLYTFDYILYVPKNADFTVSSINGHLKADVIEGDFTADLINGNIDITKYKGNLDLKTINGEIDLVMQNSRLTAETIHGQIYADEKLELKVTDRYVGQKVEGSFDNATHRLKLNTINGNMYLRL
ncbi:hypothetical protein [Flagellimonas myxillae]|uniref:hypothetical protein n=1 Tax=Flagellimonas myxillae TaxID=2942214 RepID=UPI00201EBB5F|nr:hypothetical protein [Muricauda myxillae]MCL6266901.1 hypothetical protein [Muricauda myxillae]